MAAIRSFQHSPGRSLDRAKNALDRDRIVETIMENTAHETAVYEVTGSAEGPTAVILGGMHGNEINGYRVAANITSWDIDAGRLVVIPFATILAIERNDRRGPDGDLNRSFPSEQPPESALARAIWRVITDADPDVVIDLHRSRGLFNTHHRWVGQVILHTEANRATDTATDVCRSMNDHYVPRLMRFHRFTPVAMDDIDRGTGLLIQKAQHDLDVASYLVESTDFLLDIDTQIRWTATITNLLLAEHGIQRTA
ncbi:succinylglutamate desuccinylase/aspartoacylase family protein [Halalkalicoccus subterraneus]|uniref:succinylglutamate desuccinylase/aspartoacylase family protein n=1 Tax=Halalkalicoccus subterraneus TaxID=2675002 RepID=UPI000EFAFB0B|nr:succinylglutamate desuccinylase/aspartoacylase family protein [Halalkalicoccus subterraneus]